MRTIPVKYNHKQAARMFRFRHILRDEILYGSEDFDSYGDLYLMICPKHKAVKIGRTKNMKRRIPDLKYQGHDRKMKLIHIWPGKGYLEHTFHKTFYMNKTRFTTGYEGVMLGEYYIVNNDSYLFEFIQEILPDFDLPKEYIHPYRDNYKILEQSNLDYILNAGPIMVGSSRADWRAILKHDATLYRKICTVAQLKGFLNENPQFKGKTKSINPRHYKLKSRKK